MGAGRIQGTVDRVKVAGRIWVFGKQAAGAGGDKEGREQETPRLAAGFGLIRKHDSIDVDLPRFGNFEKGRVVGCFTSNRTGI